MGEDRIDTLSANYSRYSDSKLQRVASSPCSRIPLLAPFPSIPFRIGTKDNRGEARLFPCSLTTVSRSAGCGEQSKNRRNTTKPFPRGTRVQIRGERVEGVGTFRNPFSHARARRSQRACAHARRPSPCRSALSRLRKNHLHDNEARPRAG